MRYTRRPSQRDVRNLLGFMGGAATMEAPKRKATGPRGKQKESKVNDAVKEWARMRNGVVYRNRRGMIDLPGGGKLPIGLGPNGYPDVVGYLTIQITPAMVGRRVAVFCAVESKTKDGVLADHQAACIQEIKDAGGIAGVATHAGDCEVMLATWSTRP